MSQPESSGRSVSLSVSPSLRSPPAQILTQRFRSFDAYGRPCARPEPEPDDDELPPPPSAMEVVRRVLARLFGKK
jgi:hypothetical protein